MYQRKTLTDKEANSLFKPGGTLVGLVMSPAEYNTKIRCDEARERCKIKRQLRLKQIPFDNMEYTESLRNKLGGN